MNQPSQFLSELVGTWEGTCRTWFEPGDPSDESPINAQIQPILGGLFVRHTYHGTIKNQPRSGEETLAFNSVNKEFETSWVDDFHMNYGIMFSVGEPTENGFVVTGKYAVGPGDPPWGWKTVYEKIDDEHLLITAYNVTPDGQESKAIETSYRRKGR